MCLAAMFAANSVSSLAYGYLGSFGTQDGYDTLGALGGSVTYLPEYNAGEYGTNNGGPGGSAVVSGTLNQGLWVDLNRTSDDRPFPDRHYLIRHNPVVSPTVDGNEDYLGMRNDPGSLAPNPDQSLEIRYSFDARDFNGASPTSTGNSLIDWSIYVCPGNPGSVPTQDWFQWTFRDSDGDIGLELGYNSDRFVQYRDKPGDPWSVTTHQLNSSNWDRLNVVFNMLADTWSLTIGDRSGNTFVDTTIFTDRPFNMPLDNLATADWQLRPLGETPEANKNFFDGSGFSVTVIPEPSTIVLLSLGTSVLIRRLRPARNLGTDTNGGH
jgi:hypothetical protein